VETVDFIDGTQPRRRVIPIRIKMTIKGDEHLHFTGSHPTIGSIYNSHSARTFSP